MDPDVFSQKQQVQTVFRIAVVRAHLRFVLQERRLAAVRELVRLLKAGGQALVYVWAFEQEYNKQRSKYLKEQGKEEYSVTNGTSTGSQDLRESSIPPEDAYNSAGNDQCVGRRAGAKLSVHTNRTAFKTQDLLVPWHLKDEKTQRGEHSGEISEKKKNGDGQACSDRGSCCVNRSDSEPGSDVKMLKSLGISSESRTWPGGESERSVPVYHRYYHLFQQGELEHLCGQIPGVTVQSSYHDQGNWCVVLEKTA